MSGSLTVDALWTLLAERRGSVLATVRRNGRPQLSNISYTYDPRTGVARFLAAGFRAKAVNLRRDPRASLHVTSADFRTWAVAEGTVEISPVAEEPGDPVWQEILEIYDIFGLESTPEELERLPIVDRAVFRVKIERIYGGEASKALGVSSDAAARA